MPARATEEAEISMKIIDCKQGSKEWHDCRRGRVTASRMGDILTPKTGKMGAAANTYAYELLAEELVPPHYHIKQDFKSYAMENGSNTEREARDFIAFDRGIEIDEVGLVVTDCGRFACSPDGLVGSDTGLELKCPLHTTQIKYLLDGGLPDEYKAQVFGSMIVTQRNHWIFASYAPGLPPLIVDVFPDDYMLKLAETLEKFWAMLAEMKAKIQPADPVAAIREPYASPF